MNNDHNVQLVIIDDNAGSLELLSTALAREGLRIITAQDPEEGLDIIFREHPDIVLTDLVMPGITGMEVVERVVEFDPAIDVILMTAHYTSESAVEAIQKGASDYMNKPVSIAALRDRITKLIDDTRRRRKAMDLGEELLKNAQFEGMIGRSAAMWEAFSRIRRVAPHYRSVLITGETGTGKELAARALHNLSPVAGGRFVVLNCSAVVETLFESELFGHVRGSFTGATQDKAGLFEFADKGTIFLDEIGDMPIGTQAKLLRTLQNQEILRVGSLTPRKVDVHVIAATHRDLRAAIVEKQFREDLYYRLSMIEVHLPSLLERKEDLPLLTKYFVDKYSRQFHKDLRGLTQRAQIVLSRHSWPGNVRELENVLGHACIMAVAETIDVQDLPEYLRFPSKHAAPAQHAAASAAAAGDETFESHEKRLLTDALAKAAGNQSQAARELRIGRDALRYKMRKHGLL
ncbi:MAG TPA: sigma-54 dependent transcriptional regulator [Bryobacteraceae bacterium]|jgi:DNA-binding NtrC family response regulator|nr:sigma-54 dependent transcriptional regulator [Bryobacteraceae bacterium]